MHKLMNNRGRNVKIFLCRISTADFLRVTKECIELLPTEKSKTYYCESYRNAQNESVSASGKLYSFYKVCRELFAAAGFINLSDENLVQEITRGIFILQTSTKTYL